MHYFPNKEYNQRFDKTTKFHVFSHRQPTTIFDKMSTALH